MRDEPSHRESTWARNLLFVALTLAPAAVPARAIPIGGKATVQFQHVDQRGQVFYLNGVVRDTSIAREFWSQSYQLHHAAIFGRNFSLFSQLEWVDESYTARPHVSQTATATMRLAHPLFGLAASYRPSVSKVAATSLGLPGEVGVFRPSTSRNDQTTLTADFMPPGLPRLDLSYVRQRRDADVGAPRASTVSRNANLSYATGELNMHAGYGDQLGDLGAAGPSAPARRHGNAGFGLHLDPLSALSLGMQYELSTFSTGASAGATSRSLAHTGTLNGSWRASRQTGVDLAYSFRASRLTGAIASRQATQDGSLMFAYRPNAVASASAGGGFRSLNAAQAPLLERYASASAMAAGRIRTAWSGSATASHTTLWDRDARPRSSESANLSTSVRASKEFVLGGVMNTMLNSDASVGQGRWATDAAVTATASPLRRLQFTAGLRTTHAGAGPWSNSSTARSRSLDGRWMASEGFDLAAGITQSRSGPGGGIGSTTRNARVSLRPGRRLQLSGTYSNSDQTGQIPGTSQLRGREVLSTQMGLVLTRTISMGANLNLVDPHRATFSRQYDLTLTKDFGR